MTEWRSGKRIVVFDLDDTLYPEIEYVRSGFRAVAFAVGSRSPYQQCLSSWNSR